jgi:hypothetical protein
MTNHPNVQRKLRAHLLERIPEVQDRDMTFQDVDPGNVPYLEAVVQETLRLGRITSGVARDGRWLVDQAHVVREDTVLHGYRIPKGSIVMSSAGVHYEDETFGSLGDKRRVGYWKAGTTRQFIPERWLREDWSFDADAGPTMPFSSGPRGCLGKNLAVRSTMATLIIVARAENGHFAHDLGILPCTSRGPLQLARSVRNYYHSPGAIFRKAGKVVVGARFHGQEMHYGRISFNQASAASNSFAIVGETIGSEEGG